MKKIILIFILVLILLPNNVFAETEEEIMSTTQEKFNISGFIKQAEGYISEAFEDIDLGETLNQAIQGKIDNKTLAHKLLKLLGKEISSSLKILISILVIIVIHGILKSITDNLENTNIIDLLNKKDLVFKDKDSIYEVLDYINIILFKRINENPKYTKCIKIVEETKERLRKNSNYDMTIDNLLLKIWEEING